MTAHPVVSHAEWVEASKSLLAEEKEFTRLREQLARKRRELPWERVDKSYTNETRRRKFVMIITRPNALVEPQAPLQTMGNTVRDRTVDALDAALVRSAYDCDAHREPGESAFACAG